MVTHDPYIILHIRVRQQVPFGHTFGVKKSCNKEKNKNSKTFDKYTNPKYIHPRHHNNKQTKKDQRNKFQGLKLQGEV